MFLFILKKGHKKYLPAILYFFIIKTKRINFFLIFYSTFSLNSVIAYLIEYFLNVFLNLYPF